jgi:hypothetical protein
MSTQDPPHLHDAIEELQAVRLHLARAERLRGLRAASVAFAASAALLAGVVQECWIVDPAAERGAWLTLWLATAAVCGLFAGLEMILRARLAPAPPRAASGLRTWAWFSPSLFPGAVLTWLVFTRLPGHLWLLPGLWQLLFALGCFAAWRLLPRASWLVGAFFLVTGTTSLFAQDAALTPIAMAGPFAVGLAQLAVILQRSNAERS